MKKNTQTLDMRCCTKEEKSKSDKKKRDITYRIVVAGRDHF